MWSGTEEAMCSLCLHSRNVEIGFFIQKAIYVGITLKTYDHTSPVTLQSLFSWVSALVQAPTRMIHQVTTLLIFTDSLLLLAFGKSVSFERRASFPLLLFGDTLLMFSNPFLHITSRKMIWKLLKTQQFRHKPRSLPDHLCFHSGYVASPKQWCTKQFSSLELGKTLGEIKRKTI